MAELDGTFKTWQPAEPGTLFAANAFAASVGKSVPMKIDVERVRNVTLIDAKVSVDGSGVTLTFR